MLANKTIAFLGAGSMAEAMISGIVESKTVRNDQVIVSNRCNEDRLIELSNRYGIRGQKRDELNFEEVDIFVLAMKPKDIDNVLSSIKGDIRADQVVLSVLAGIPTAYMEDRLNDNQQVIRVMPNTSSMIGESATAMSPGKHTGMDNVMDAKELLKSIGEVYIIEEAQMDIFTGIAGSGPAYFYYLMEHIEKVGKENGLDIEQARKIGAQTILGAAKMMMTQEEAPEELRKKVTSPNGTTQAGLEALKEYGGGEAISQAVKGAAKRSKEISEKLEKVTIK
ncbi:pyrroline-5-carboxylate reductase [Metabacillus arenae]|uniref:Pyrroline-5-carboxylate reductase n=1 Tax=Metabacillus arenae TaxID=2771434 RepID=A0A926ND49_9BACI|nr:pyrroline-5-carboxylate reductase [Metabacillus arenae]MBD1379329.1 pyrroline-5-carboxylate reductase [Metabacillus arenae]